MEQKPAAASTELMQLVSSSSVMHRCLPFHSLHQPYMYQASTLHSKPCTARKVGTTWPVTEKHPSNLQQSKGSSQPCHHSLEDKQGRLYYLRGTLTATKLLILALHTAAPKMMTVECSHSRPTTLCDAAGEPIIVYKIAMHA